MNVIEFIKRNISVFNFIGFSVFFLILYLSFTEDSNSFHGMIGIFFMFLILFLSLFFLFDMIMKYFFTNRLLMNIIQFIVATFIIIYFKNLS